MNQAEPSPARKALTVVVLVILLFAAVIVQLTMVNRLPLPGGAAPDLVLLLVTAIAVCTSPLAGALAGFAGGLALDIAPPAVNYAGEYALVFCLVGWGAARVTRVIWDVRGTRDQVTTFAVMAGAAAAGEAGKAALGMMLSDPDVTGAVASRVLPAAILYDLLVAPFAFWLVARITRGTGFLSTVPAPQLGVEQRLALVFRSASDGAAPRLRLAGSGADYRKPPPRQVPRLRLSDGRPDGRTYAAIPDGAAVPRPGGRTRRLSFAGDLPAQTKQRAPRGPGRGWITAAAAAGLAGTATRRASHAPGKGWITAGSLARPSGTGVSRAPGKGWITAGSLARPSGRRVSRAPGKGWITAGSLAGPAGKRTAHGPGRGWLTAARPGGPGGLAVAGQHRPRSAADALAARSAPSGLSALAGSGTPMAAWSRRRAAPRRAIRASAFRGTRAYHGNWYTAAPSGEWLRRSRHPWRKRSRRLLRLVGVGR